MDAIELLTTRSSMPRLIAPGPDAHSLALIQQAALRVPDHMALMPVRCDIVQGDSLIALGHLFEKAARTEPGFSSQDVDRAAQLPLRAPMLIVVSTAYQAHDKVPKAEQFATAACATMAMQQACFAQGLGAIWRSGPYTHSATVKAGLGIADHDDIVGFLYVGTPAVPTPIKPAKENTIFRMAKIDINS
ncbi:MAG: nitroreductase [Idiomarina sp.]|nr:nitroreductase [Idiomarina sp.]MCL5049006.1 nitroreductase family protein [Bacillota bacterium]